MKGADRGTAFATALTVALIAVVLAGEYFTSVADQPERSASAEWSDGSVTIEVSSDASDAWDAVLVDNGGRASVSTLRIYVYESYEKLHDAAGELLGVGPAYFDQEYFADQMVKMLEFRGFGDCSPVDSEELEEYLISTLSDPVGKGLMVSSYVVPESVYDGTEDSLLVKWVEAGGTLYWVGSPVGGLRLSGEGLERVSRSESLFFGRSGITDMGSESYDDYVTDEVVPNGFADALSLKNTNTLFGIDADGLGGVELGTVREGHASISIVPKGGGDVCVFGGCFDINLFDDMCQTIACGLTSSSELAAHASGTATRETVRETLDFDAGTDPALYVYTGGTYMNYGVRLDERDDLQDGRPPRDPLAPAGLGARGRNRPSPPRDDDRPHLRLGLLGDSRQEQGDRERALRPRRLLLHARLGIRPRPDQRPPGRVPEPG